MATDALVQEVLEITKDVTKCLSAVRMAKSTQRNYVADLLPEIAISTLLIWGKQDRITPPDVALQFERMLPDAKLVWLDNCGHAPMMEKPMDFNSALAFYLHTQQCD
jgi:pimeloyl-ACP methyl ester carboxylesterase